VLPSDAPNVVIDPVSNTVTISGFLNWTFIENSGGSNDFFLARPRTDYTLVIPFRGSPFDPDFVPPTEFVNNVVQLPGNASAGFGDPKRVPAALDNGWFDRDETLIWGAFDTPTPLFGLGTQGIILDQVIVTESEIGRLDATQYYLPVIATDPTYSTITSIGASYFVEQPLFGCDGFTTELFYGAQQISGGGARIADYRVANGIGDGGGGSDGGGGGGSEPSTEIAEVGTLTLTDARQTVALLNSYVNPVILINPLSFNGSQPAVARLDNITGNSFDAFIQEPNNEDGLHTAETVSYFVVEAGTWQLSDGTLLEAGTLSARDQVPSSFAAVDFDTSFDGLPAVFSQVQTFNGTDLVRTRQRDITRTGFQVGMEEEEANLSTPHVNETLGFVAIDRGPGAWDGNPFLVRGSGEVVTDEPTAVGFGGTFTSAPNLIASLTTYNGPDPAGVRHRNLSANSVELALDEDTSADSETDHVAEGVTVFAIEGEGALTAAAVMGEFGSLSLDSTPQSLAFRNTYTNPVAFVQPLAARGSDPAVARLRNVSSSNLRVFVQEPNYLDGNHLAETAGYFAFEEGSWELDDGTRLEIGTIETDRLSAAGFESVSFATPFASAPVVMTQVQTFNGPDFVTTRQRNVTATGFEVALQEEEVLNSGAHATETVGYLAIAAGSGTWSGNAYQAGRSADSLTDSFSPVNYEAGLFGSAPRLLASLGFDGVDPAHLRFRNATAAGVQLKVEEEQSFDAETIHTTEAADFLAVEGSGLLSAIAV